MAQPSTFWSRRVALTLLLGAATLAGTSCGFALRQPPQFAFHSIYLDLPNDTGTGPALRRALQEDTQLQVQSERARADVVLQVLGDTRDRTVVGRDVSGQVRELQLRQRLRFRVRTPAGKELLPEVEISRQIDQSFSEGAALSKEVEEQRLFEYLQNDIVQQLLRRLATLKL